MSSKVKLTYEQVKKFTEAKIPDEVEDEILTRYAEFSLEGDMVVKDMVPYFESLELPRRFYKHVRKDQVVIEGTDIVDFDKLLKLTYHKLSINVSLSMNTSMW